MHILNKGANDMTTTILDSQDVDNTQYSVWVGGTEVNDYLVDKETAEEIAGDWTRDGYDDVKIEEVAFA
jgi:hypothetical protein